MASSSLSSSCEYEVFLSFRGEDTRENITSHLFKELSERKKVKTFIDEDMRKGDEISPALLNVIEGSMISIIILSKDYASSKWCLDELAKILQWKETNGQIVIPVFYHLHPSEVRNQTGCFAEAFRKHEKNSRKMPAGKIQNWRAALKEVSYLSGHESEKIRPESKLVDVIVKDVLKKLEDIKVVPTDFDGLVGINSRIDRVKSLLCIGLQDFRIVGIWGMGGIGKTTLADAIFKQVSRDFEGKCFMENVRGKLEKGSELKHLRKELFSHLLDETLLKVDPNLPQHTLERLQRTKVFIVLDDVNELKQLQCLAKGIEKCNKGSRIIVTTRDKKVLDGYGVKCVYKVEELNHCEAHQHFNNFAFTLGKCREDLMELSNRVVDYAKGNPLALKVLGSFLRSEKKPEWETALHNLNRISHPDVFDVLKISYNELDHDVKDIFLDIACFFNGDDKNHVISISYDRNLMHYGLDLLKNKSLITISHNRLKMHDLLQEMGREIVRQESQDVGKRSRLWHPDDVCLVLNRNKGTDSIKGIFLNLSKIGGDICLNSRVFTSMSNLRLLQIYVSPQFGQSDMSFKVQLPQGLEYLSDELRYLYWHGYPLTMLPVNFSPDNLIELSLPYSEVRQLWAEKKTASKLESIDLQHCQDLSRIPDPSEIPNLKRINLLNCINFSCIPSTIQHFSHLGVLRLRGCKSLSYFPNDIHFRCPIVIDLSNCINLTVFPQIFGNIRELDLCNTAIEEVPSSIKDLTCLENLCLQYCRRLTNLSTSICKLRSLRQLDLSECSNFEKFPEILEQMESLESINLSYTKIKQLPSSIELMTGLTKFHLSECRELDSLPTNLGKLKSLNFIYGSNLAISRLPPSITHLNKLERFLFSQCRGLVLPPLSGLTTLRELYLSACGIIEIPQDIGRLSSLESLSLTENNFENIPPSIKELSQLRNLFLDHCNVLRGLPELPLQLSHLGVKNCKQLESLPELPECLEKLDASLLETNFRDSEALNPYTLYRFDGCLKLKENTNNILADSQLRIQHMAVTLLKIFHFYGKKPYGMTIYLPGSGNIPEWFSNRCSGSSITIQLPQYSCNRNFIGFALCAVFGFEEDSHTRLDSFYVKCRYNFDSKTPLTIKHFGGTDFSRCTSTFLESDEVFLGFDPCWTVRLPDGDHHAAVTINFKAYFDFSLRNVKFPKVKCCGVCPLYAHINESPPNTFTVNMVPPTEEEYTQIMKLNKDSPTTEEEVEPSPKRIPPKNINAPYRQGSLFSRVFLRKRVCLFVFLIFVILLCLRLHWKLTFDR